MKDMECREAIIRLSNDLGALGFQQTVKIRSTELYNRIFLEMTSQGFRYYPTNEDLEGLKFSAIEGPLVRIERDPVHV